MSRHEDILALYYGHDSTVALIRDGELVEAMSEERLARVKKYIGFPHLALAYVIEKYQLTDIKDVHIGSRVSLGLMAVTLEENKQVRASEAKYPWFTAAILVRFAPLRLVRDLRRSFKDWWRASGEGAARARAIEFLRTKFPDATFHFHDHHLMHAWASVPFMPDYTKKRIILTLDGEGDGNSGTISLFENGRIEVKHTFPVPASLGYLYSAFVDLLGMKHNEHEFKVMGLAPYAKKNSGEKVYAELKKMLWFDTDAMTIRTSIDTRGATAELVARDFSTRHRFDSLAYGIQKLTEEVIKTMARAAIEKYKCHDLAVGGGVFMNVKANQYLVEMPEVKSLVVTPSGGDESLAIGAAVAGYAMQHNGNISKLKPISGLYFGSSYSDADIKAALDAYDFIKKCDVRHFPPSGGDTIEKEVAKLLASNSVVGRFKGRAEWGARALGNRSILANPSSRDNVKLINEMIKGRDFWMPFATSLLAEDMDRYLINPTRMMAPYMAITFETTEKAHRELPAALHPYDLTSRPQMVSKEMNPEYHALISHFKELTGISGILNTSFNLHGEPNVEAPIDALRTFEHSGLPHLAIGNYLISKR